MDAEINAVIWSYDKENSQQTVFFCEDPNLLEDLSESPMRDESEKISSILSVPVHEVSAVQDANMQWDSPHNRLLETRFTTCVCISLSASHWAAQLWHPLLDLSVG